MRNILLAAAIGVSVLSMPFGALAQQPAPAEPGISVDAAVVKTVKVVRKTTTHRTVRRTWHRRTTHTRTTRHSSSSGASSSSK